MVDARQIGAVPFIDGITGLSIRVFIAESAIVMRAVLPETCKKPNAGSCVGPLPSM